MPSRRNAGMMPAEREETRTVTEPKTLLALAGAPQHPAPLAEAALVIVEDRKSVV